MLTSFFKSKSWKDALRSAFANNVAVATIAIAQDKNLIVPTRLLLPGGVGALVGTVTENIYGGTKDLHGTALRIAILYSNVMLPQDVAIFFDGDVIKAKIAIAITLACIFLVLANLINPPPVLATPAPVLPPPKNKNFRERFEFIKEQLDGLLAEETQKSHNLGSVQAKKLANLRKLKDRMIKFEEKYQNTNFVLMNDPISIPESGAICDRENLKSSLAHGINTCPITSTPLKVCLQPGFVNQIAADFRTKNEIDGGLKQIERRFLELQKATPIINPKTESKAEPSTQPNSCP